MIDLDIERRRRSPSRAPDRAASVRRIRRRRNGEGARLSYVLLWFAVGLAGLGGLLVVPLGILIRGWFVSLAAQLGAVPADAAISPDALWFAGIAVSAVCLGAAVWGIAREQRRERDLQDEGTASESEVLTPTRLRAAS